jgi:endoglucanase
MIGFRSGLATFGFAITLSVPLGAAVSPQIHVDHFGYRTNSTKVAIFATFPGATVQVQTTAGMTVFTVPTDGGAITSRGFDADSGDTVWWVDFSPFATPGEYRLHSSSLNAQSYDFEIGDEVYGPILRAALKGFYLQRCNTPKLAVHVGAWADEAACHMGDLTTTAAAGQTNYGTRDLTGGWHDAGDYNKYAWGAVGMAIFYLLNAFEDNPLVWGDDLNIPESGNGQPDVLDEVRWELDWLLKMQRAGGEVFHQMHVPGFASDSPPSADSNLRFYYNPNIESAAILAGSAALAARVFAAQGDAAYAATLKNAALAAWNWLQAQPDCNHNNNDCKTKVWAAAELYRLDTSVTSARAYVDSYWPSNWNGVFFNVVSFDTQAAWTYLEASGATSAVTTNMRANIDNQVDYIFSEDDHYRSGMPDWSYYWGSNAIRAGYGVFLMKAANLGETGAQTAAATRRRAEELLRFFHGQNPLSMVYLTNMSSLGGEHSSYQLYHAWFGDSHHIDSRADFIGKPPATAEPSYPYFAGTDNHGVADNKTSTLGPPPGIVVGGPNQHYSGDAQPPRTQGGDPSCTPRNRCYRDWNEQRFGPEPRTWEITENSIGYQGTYVALASYFAPAALDPNLIFADGFESGDTSAWN